MDQPNLDQPKKNNTGIVIAVVIVLLCCCVLILGALGVVLWETAQEIPGFGDSLDIPLGPATARVRSS